MISRAILILKSADGAARGVAKLTGDGRDTRVELRVDGFLPDMMAIRTESYFDVVSVGNGNMLLPPIEMDSIEVACIQGDRIRLYGANSRGDSYSMRTAVEDYLSKLKGYDEPTPTALETEELSKSSIVESVVDDEGVSDDIEPPYVTDEVVEPSLEYDDVAEDNGESDKLADAVIHEPDYDDEPIVEAEDTVYTELYESVEIEEPRERIGFLFGEIPVRVEEGVRDFYYSVKETLDELFVCFPEDRDIASMIPGKWVRIDSDDGYYVVGVVYEGGEPAYVCYGVPRLGDVAPPEELSPYCELIEDGERAYWVMFQDAKTGKTIEPKKDVAD